MNVKDKARMYRELAKLLGASFPMDKSITMLLGQQPAASRRQFLSGIQRGFEQRMGFAEAMRTFNQGLATSLELSLIDSGERSGRLAESCLHLANYFETWHKGIRAARTAMVYPLLLLHLGVVLPEITRNFMMTALGRETHPAAAIIWRLVIFWILLVVLALLWRALSRAAVRSESIDRVLNLLPLIGAVRRHWALSRFCQVFHSGLLAAMHITDCLRMAGDASQSGTLLNGSRKAEEAIRLGRPLSESFEGAGRFPRDFINSIATAEAAGGLDTEMGRWAAAETDYAAEAQQAAAEWYPKALYFGIVGYVGYRVVALFTEYYGSIMDMTK
ncbi:MAG: PulF [Verrucomicrobiaceae bacterium]|nr:PulF [Verrucomicrobiaceae bacterium]